MYCIRKVKARGAFAATVALAVLALTALAPAAAHAGGGGPPPISFAKEKGYLTGGWGGSGWHETSVVSADFNNDGAPDVLVADFFSFGDGPFVMLNKGDGTFQTPGKRVEVGILYGTLIAGDVNEDGNMDVVATNTLLVTVLLGNGDGTFTVGQSQLLLQGGQEDAVFLDANGDGHLDVAVATRYGLQTILGYGDGTFDYGTISAPGVIFPSAIDDANFDNDGIADVLLIDGAGQAIAMKGHGNGQFSRIGTAFGGLIFGTGLAGDLNNDGLDDVVALPEFNIIRNATVILNKGGGSNILGSPKYYDGGLAPVSGELADLDLDGDLDIISSDTVGSQQVVLRNKGDGKFETHTKSRVSIFPQTPAVADFDGDGRTDVACAGIDLLGRTVLSVLINTTPY